MLQHVCNNYNIIWKCCCSVAKLYPTLCPSLSHGVCSNSYLLSQRCHPTISSSVISFLSCLQSFPASGFFPVSPAGKTFGASFSLSISPYGEYAGLISFRIDWLDLLAVQRTLKSLLQHHNSRASILLCLSFFMVQLSHPYVTTGKTIALTSQIFVGKVMSLWYTVWVCHSFPSKEQASLNFIAVVTICSDFFSAQENKVCHCLQLFPHLLAMKW